MSNFVDRFKEMKSGNKLIIGSFLIAIISLFLPWIETGGLKLNGIEQTGYLFLLFYIYPLYKVLRGEDYDSKIGMVSGLIMIILSILYNRSKNLGIFSKEVNTPAIGLYIFILSGILFTFGNYKNRPIPEGYGEDEDLDQEAGSLENKSETKEAREEVEARAEKLKKKAEAEAKEAREEVEAKAEKLKKKAEAEAKDVKEEVEAGAEKLKKKAEAEAKEAREEVEAKAEKLKKKAEAEAKDVKEEAADNIIDMTDDKTVDKLQK